MKIIYTVRLICTRQRCYGLKIEINKRFFSCNNNNNRLLLFGSFWNLSAVAKRGILQPSKFDTLRKWHRKDKCSMEYELIYRSSFDLFFKGLGVITGLTVCFCIVMAIEDVLIRTGHVVRTEPIGRFLVVNNMRHSDYGGEIFNVVLITINFLLLRLIGRCPLRIYRHKQQQPQGSRYIAVYQRYCLPWSLMTHEFTNATKYTPLLSYWKRHYFKLDKRVSILMADNFKTASELFHMIGDDTFEPAEDSSSKY